jgi:predicted PurR-regulated permease PerM
VPTVGDGGRGAEPPAPAPDANRALPAMLVAVTLGFGWIVLPFYGTLLWAAVIALVFRPVFRALLPRLQRRHTPAALLTLALAVVIAVLPLAMLSAVLASEAMTVYERVQSGEWKPALYVHQMFDALPAWATALLDRFGLADFEVLQRRLTALVGQASQLIATRVFSIGQGTFEFVAEVCITVYIAFFLVRDGDALLRAVRRALPLAPRHKQVLLEKFATVVRATVKGNLLVAAIQGALGGLAFWYLGVGAALLWAVLMALLSLLPAVGAALVWVPVAIYFFAIGALWQGVALCAWGMCVIGLVDNLLRPVLVGKDTGMPDWLVMISTLGGMAAFGINGFVLGPAIAAMFLAVWHIDVLTRADAAPP